MVRVRAEARECIICVLLLFLWLFISVVNICLRSVYSLGKCSRQVTYEYSIGDVTTWSWVNLVTPSVGVRSVRFWYSKACGRLVEFG